jgi:hypothetical protein
MSQDFLLVDEPLLEIDRLMYMSNFHCMFQSFYNILCVNVSINHYAFWYHCTFIKHIGSYYSVIVASNYVHTKTVPVFKDKHYETSDNKN